MIEKTYTHSALRWLKIQKFFPQPRVASWLLDNFKTTQDMFSGNDSDMLDKGWPKLLLKRWQLAKAFKGEQLKGDLEKHGVGIVCIEDPNYPPLLKVINNPPALLFYRGNLKYLLGKTVSIIGSRKCSSWGFGLAKKISSLLAANDYTVVSGLASGIDTAAHRGALESGKTAAILGCGLNVCYPASNRDLYKKVTNNGCLVSEFTLDTKPLKHHFPYRNRIISGLSDALIIIQAGEKSGAMITANLALDQGREVLAVPGSPNESYSKGCNKLIKDGAFLIDDIEDIENFFEIQNKNIKTQVNDPILKILEATPKSLEELVVSTNNTPPSLLAKLTQLEITQLVSKDEQNKYYLLP